MAHCAVAAWSASLALGQGGAWAPRPSMPTGRYSARAVEVGGKVYVVGGVVSACGRTAALESFDPATGLWSSKTPMPTARGTCGAGVIGGKIYVVGGESGCSTNFATNEVYDPITDAWQPRAPLPSPRYHHGVGVVNGILYVVGGALAGAPQSSLFAYDPVSNAWTTKAPMPTARYGLAVAVLNGILYACGGNNPGSQAVEAYDPLTNTWQAKASMPVSAVWTSAAAAGGRVYVVGGDTPQGAGIVQGYDPCTDTWSLASPLPTPRLELTSVAAGGLLYAIGGTPQGSTTYLAVVESLAPLAVISTGRGCAGGGAAPLAIGTNALPRIPAPSFAIAIGGGPANAPTALMLASDLSVVPIPIGGGCFVFANPFMLLVTLPAAQPSTPLPLPNLADLVGRSLVLQGAAVNPTNLALATSNALTLGFSR